MFVIGASSWSKSLRAVAAALFTVASLAQAPGYAQGGAPCVTNWDCSLAGVCNTTRVCECDAWATGPSCALLNLAPGRPGDGLQVPGYFSWGGHALHDGSEYQLFASFMCRHATLSEWTTKSSIWRATSADVRGPYTLAEMVAQPWSHNAMIAATQDPSFPFAVFQIGDAVTPSSEWAPCFNASEAETVYTASALPTTPRRRARVGGRDANSIYVRTAPALTGPWTSLNGNNTALPIVTTGSWATGGVNGGNPAPLFFANGTALLYFSANPCPPGWGNISPGNNCIGVARAAHWAGPYTALPLPVTHPESEDAHVFVDARGSFHLLTNVNNDHTRCAQGVPCGGHAWSYDGITFSNLTIGAFGPVIRFENGSYWRNAYAERPQVTQAADGTPLALFLGLGRTSYYDSATWVQQFCVPGQAGCGPTLPPPSPPPVRARYSSATAPSRCIATNASFPCPGGWGNSCPLYLDDCAAPTATWLERADGLIESVALPGQCMNIDCNSCSAHTVAKVIQCASASAIAWDATTMRLGIVTCGGSCLDDGSSGAPTPPCKDSEFFLSQQLAVAACTQENTQFARTVVGNDV